MRDMIQTQLAIREANVAHLERELCRTFKARHRAFNHPVEIVEVCNHLRREQDLARQLRSLLEEGTDANTR